MKPLTAALTAALFVLSVPSGPLSAETPKKDPAKPPKAAPTAIPVTTQQSGGVAVTTGQGAEPPANAKPANIEDFRVFPERGDDPYEYERMGLAAVQKNQLDYARGFFEKSWETGELPTAAYNLACVEAREGKLDKAFQQLEKAVGAGFDDQKTALSDPDMEPLRRDTVRFNKAIAGMQKNRVEGDAAVVSEAVIVPPDGPWRSILVLLHDASSDPLFAAGPFADETRARGIYLVVPRGPARGGKRRFGWGSAERAFLAVDSIIETAQKKAGPLPTVVLGLGRGGTLAYTVAARKPGVFVAVGSLGGAYDPGQAGNPESASYIAGTGLKGARLFLGVPANAPANLLTGFRRGLESLRKLGFAPVYREWPGTGTTLPSDIKAAVDESLNSLFGRAG